MIERSMKYECYKDLPHYTGNKFKDELMLNAKKLATPGKGILASDESTGTIGNRFKQIDVENTHENRIAYRELLFTTPKLEDHISGAIIYDETARDKGSDGKDLIQHLKDKDILIGLKVDTGMVIIEGTNDESATQGLDGLGNRCKEYYEMGTRFAKWRAVVKIGDGCPSDVSIKETAHSLARYGNICQHNGIVPIIEPEILTDGKHDIKECARISEKVFNAVMAELIEQGLLLEGLLLKPNMILPGAECPEKACPEEVAFYTVRTLSRTITPAIPGITFLSGGQSEENASLNLNAIN
jgi:fructose-bisphosphate aldolase, class I